MNDILGRRPSGPETPITAADLDPDPVSQLQSWLEAALAAGTREPNAMTLATADASGTPSARVVLLRGLDDAGLTWYTNRTSLKGRDLAANPRAAVVFHWELVQRQVRVAGDVSLVSDAEGAAYFAARPRKSQLSAWASPQGRPLDDRATLEAATQRIDEQFPESVPLPPFWGGYRLRPSMFEFWQGRRDRMHDRFSYLRDGDGWHIERLAP